MNNHTPALTDTHRIIAGALFDLFGMLTTSDERHVFSRTDDAAPAVDVLKQFAAKRGLHLDEADVANWTDALAAAPAAQPDMADAYAGAREDLAIWRKRALEAEALNRKFIREVNGQTFMGEPAAQPAEPEAQPSGLWGWDRRATTVEKIIAQYCDTNFERLLPYQPHQLVRSLAALLLECQMAVVRSQPADAEMLGEFDSIDRENHRLRRGMQKLMERLAMLLDEHQFADCESIVEAAGVKPPAAQPRSCTCHPDDNRPQPCAQKYALSECRTAQPADEGPAFEDGDNAEGFHDPRPMNGFAQPIVAQSDKERFISDEQIRKAIATCRLPFFPDQTRHESEEKLIRFVRTLLADAKAAKQPKSYVETIPDHCDRIVWRGRYYHLPLNK